MQQGTTPRRQIVVSRKLPAPVEARLRRDYDAILNAADEPLGRECLVKSCQDADALICTVGDAVDGALIAALPPRVQAIATFSAGADHIDLGAARARGIVVTNTPDVLTDATAEVTLLLMLAAARRAAEGFLLTRGGGWTGWSPTQLMGMGLTRKRLGVLGFGRIGQAVARCARAGFGMEVHYRARSCNPASEAAVGGAIFHAGDASFLPSCDVLSLHCPRTPETERWLNQHRISLLPRGALVVNTARGELVDDDALVAALRSGRVAGAGLDVFASEPAFDARYRDLESVFTLPHLGSATVETRVAMGMRALDNLDAVLAGRQPQDRLA